MHLNTTNNATKLFIDYNFKLLVLSPNDRYELQKSNPSWICSEMHCLQWCTILYVGIQNLGNKAEEMQNILGLQLDNWTLSESDERSPFCFFQEFIYLHPSLQHYLDLNSSLFFFSHHNSSPTTVLDLDQNDEFYWNNQPHTHVCTYRPVCFRPTCVTPDRCWLNKTKQKKIFW